MSAQVAPKVIKVVAREPIGDTIALSDALETQLRRIVREEMREFLLAQRRAAKYIDSAIIQQLGLTTS